MAHSPAVERDFSKSDAELLQQLSIMPGLTWKRWRISPAEVRYSQDNYHTVSHYLVGGDSSYRKDIKSKQGHAGLTCVMPQTHQSQWNIANQVEFAHFYFSDDELKQQGVNLFDKDARLIEIRDHVYENDAVLQYLFAQCQLNHSIPLLLEQIGIQFFQHLLSYYNNFSLKDNRIRGGLSPTQRKLVQDYIDAHLANKITLQELAEFSGLSTFHFARAFRQSFAQPPAQYINQRRISRVKDLLSTKRTLAEIAMDTGFSQQSHMTSNFKARYSMTPGEYRNICN